MMMKLIQGMTCVFALMWGGAKGESDSPATRMNVLFLAVDDMRGWVNCMNNDYPGRIHTPHMDQLAAEGRLFTNAHVPAPMCGPCRAAVLTGQLPSRLGVYSNDQWLKPSRPELVTLPGHFKMHGYHVAGSGKIAHHTAGFNPPDDWHEFREIDWEDPWDRPKFAYPNKGNKSRPAVFPVSGLSKPAHERDWGSLPNGYDYHDPKTADYAIEFLKSYQSEKPFFLACGMFRPHLPWYSPKSYFDLYPLDEIKIPSGVKAGDVDDLPAYAKRVIKSHDYRLIQNEGKYKEAIQAYLASVSFADAQIGRVLQALKASPYRENTLVVLWSDHGWHHGEKNHWMKWTLWEDATRIPLMISGPSVEQAGVPCHAPVSALSLFPTLIDLCGLPKPKQVMDERSLRPLLVDPEAEWKGAVLIQRGKGECAVRSQTHRYIRYADGSEELYDLVKDPHEWNNLASNPANAAVIESLARYLPKLWSDPLPKKSAFDFNPDTYTWKKK